MKPIETDIEKNLAAQRWQETLTALEDVRLGRVIDGDRVHTWLKSWGKANELNPPDTTF